MIYDRDIWRDNCDFTSFSIVFQSYQDDGQMMMKAVCNGTPFTVEKISSQVRIELGTSRSVVQHLTHLPRLREKEECSARG